MENVMKTLLKSTIVACALILPQIAQAALVTDWEYEVFSEWTGASFDAGVGTQVQDATEISWGGTAAYTNQAAGIGTARSALILTDSFSSGTDLVTGSIIPALTNIITHWNNTLQGSFSTLVGAQLKTTLKLKPFLPVEADDFFPPKVLNFTINFTETPNDSDCGFDSESSCDDIFVISIGNLSDSFDYDGYTYTTNIVETTLSLTALSPEACAAADAAVGCLGFQTKEKEATSAQFGLLIDAKLIPEVPEPAGLAVFGLSLMGFVMYGRRRLARK
jgi:hypothetical protein